MARRPGLVNGARAVLSRLCGLTVLDGATVPPPDSDHFVAMAMVTRNQTRRSQNQTDPLKLVPAAGSRGLRVNRLDPLRRASSCQ